MKISASDTSSDEKNYVIIWIPDDRDTGSGTYIKVIKIKGATK